MLSPLTGLPAGLWIKEMSFVQNMNLSIHNKKLGCIPCRKVGNLGLEAKVGMKVFKECANNEITHFSINRKQQLISLRKKVFVLKETASHKAALNIVAEAGVAPIENMLLQALSREKL